MVLIRPFGARPKAAPSSSNVWRGEDHLGVLPEGFPFMRTTAAPWHTRSMYQVGRSDWNVSVFSLRVPRRCLAHGVFEKACAAERCGY